MAGADAAKKSGLTESDWEAVYSARCRSKRGLGLSDDEQRLCAAAFAEDKDRYSRMSSDVFVDTAPFGSTIKQ